MPTIEQSYVIQAIPEDVWDALTNPDRIPEWSGAPAEFKAEPGAEYWLWNGDIRGQIVEAVPQERLVQTWKPRNWEVEDSVVTFILTPTPEGTRVDLVHDNVQDWDYDSTTEGWDLYYLGAIKRMIEGRAEKPEPTTRKRAAAKKTTRKKTTASRKATAKRAKPPAKKAAAKKTSAKKASAKKSASRKRSART